MRHRYDDEPVAAKPWHFHALVAVGALSLLSGIAWWLGLW